MPKYQTLGQLSSEIESLRFYMIRMVEETGSFTDPMVVSISQLLDKKLNLMLRWNRLGQKLRVQKIPS